MNRNGNNKGFTLLEVMLALAIFALAGTALVKTVNSSLMGSDHLETSTLANWVASNQLVELTLSDTWPPKKADGKVDMANREWFYQQIVTETEDTNLRAVTIEVRLDEKSDSTLASLTTYISNPKAGQ